MSVLTGEFVHPKSNGLSKLIRLPRYTASELKFYTQVMIDQKPYYIETRDLPSTGPCDVLFGKFVKVCPKRIMVEPTTSTLKFNAEELTTIGMARIESLLQKSPQPPDEGSFFPACMLLPSFPALVEDLAAQESRLAGSKWDRSELGAIQILKNYDIGHLTNRPWIIELEAFSKSDKNHALAMECFRAHHRECTPPTAIIKASVRYVYFFQNHECGICNGYPIDSGYVYFSYKEFTVALLSLLNGIAREIFEKNRINAVKNEAFLQNASAQRLEALDKELQRPGISELFPDPRSRKFEKRQVERFQGLLRDSRKHAVQAGVKNRIELSYEGSPRDHIDKFWPPCISYKDGYPKHQERLRISPVVLLSYTPKLQLPLWLALFHKNPAKKDEYINFLAAESSRPNGVNIAGCGNLSSCGMCPYSSTEKCKQGFEQRFGRRFVGNLKNPQDYIINAYAEFK